MTSQSGANSEPFAPKSVNPLQDSDNIHLWLL